MASHMASSKECCEWKAEKSILELKSVKGLSVGEARKQVYQRPSNQLQLLLHVDWSSAHSVFIQTTLTWPLSLSSPVEISSETVVPLATISSSSDFSDLT